MNEDRINYIDGCKALKIREALTILSLAIKITR